MCGVDDRARHRAIIIVDLPSRFPRCHAVCVGCVVFLFKECKKTKTKQGPRGGRGVTSHNGVIRPSPVGGALAPGVLCDVPVDSDVAGWCGVVLQPRAPPGCHTPLPTGRRSAPQPDGHRGRRRIWLGSHIPGRPRVRALDAAAARWECGCVEYGRAVGGRGRLEAHSRRCSRLCAFNACGAARHRRNGAGFRAAARAARAPQRMAAAHRRLPLVAPPVGPAAFTAHPRPPSTQPNERLFRRGLCTERVLSALLCGLGLQRGWHLGGGGSFRRRLCPRLLTQCRRRTRRAGRRRHWYARSRRRRWRRRRQRRAGQRRPPGALWRAAPVQGGLHARGWDAGGRARRRRRLHARRSRRRWRRRAQPRRPA